MATIKAFLQRRAVLAYFALVFALSWGGVIVMVGPGNIPGTPEQVEQLFPRALLALLVGPGVAGLLLTGLVHGKAGLRAFRDRLLTWRVGARWYAVALLTVPLLATAILAALSRISPVFLPSIITADDRATLLLTGVAVGLMGGFLEELGWTGFAIPGLRRRHGALATGLIVGLLWAVWHVLPTVFASGDAAGALAPALFLPPFLFYVAVLPVYRVLMVRVYDRTGSLLVAMLMHASLIASTLFMLAPEATGVALATYYLVLAAALWGVIAAVAVADGGQLARRPLRARAA